MAIKIIRGGSASKADIEALESSIGQKLNSEVLSFVKENDGAFIEPNTFNVNGIENMGSINHFIEVSKILDERKNIKVSSNGQYPIAIAAGGNYLLINQDMGGSIYFIDHEIGNPPYFIANSLNEFIDLLSPVDQQEFSLGPNQVKSVWIDPSFIEELDKYR